MPRRPIRRTVREHPEACPDAAAAVAREAPRARGGSALAPAARREAAIRKLVDKYGDPLEILAKAMSEAKTADDKASHAARFVKYVYPELRAAEVTGAGGDGPVIVEVRKA